MVQSDGGGASRSTDPAAGSSAATDVSLREYIEAIIRERDQRYSEVALEREKALKIKETADLAALQLAREIQTYKDEKANELREQINSERGLYVTQTQLKQIEEKLEATLKPVTDYVSSQQGSRAGALDQRTLIAWGIAAVLGLWAVAQAFM